MFNKKKADIVVLGAGPVGLTAAHALTDRGMDFVLFDREQRINSHSYALALHPETLQLLDTLNIVQPVLDKALKLERVAIYEADQQKAVIDYSKLPVKYPYLAVIGQNELENILVQTLAKKGKKPRWNHRSRLIEYDESGHLHLTVDRMMDSMTGYAVAYIGMEIDKVFTYKANYLIGADGHDSNARRVADIAFNEVAPSTDYAVFEFETGAQLPMEMRLIVDGDRVHCYWPLPGNRCRFSFQMKPGTIPAASMDKDHHPYAPGNPNTPELTQAHLEKLLAEHAPWFQGDIQRIDWRMLVHFEERLAECFGRDRIWLAGDAAHTTPPAGILSMNVGMHEAADLVDRLHTTGNDEVRLFRLHAYDADRQGEWKRLLDTDHHIVGKDATAAWLLSHHDSIIGNIPASGETLSAILKQLHLSEAA